MFSNWCLTASDSAATARTPPGRAKPRESDQQVRDQIKQQPHREPSFGPFRRSASLHSSSVFRQNYQFATHTVSNIFAMPILGIVDNSPLSFDDAQVLKVKSVCDGVPNRIQDVYELVRRADFTEQCHGRQQAHLRIGNAIQAANPIVVAELLPCRRILIVLLLT
jgi:hypothetical protein